MARDGLETIDSLDDGPLYVARTKLYPQDVKGPFRRAKWIILAITLGIYYFLPFVRWDRGPNAPDQAVLIDLANRRFYFFFIEIWPQEVYYITGLLIIAAFTLFLMNAVAGRVWCGYLCPQTVWTDLFYAVERAFEGDRRERMKLDKEGWSLKKAGEKAGKHLIWLLIAWATGGAWVLYFADAPTLMVQLATFTAPPMAYMWIGILTFTTYALAGHMKEQVCTYMCPWPRIQAALTDEEALNVTYRHDRGEPRTHLKAARKMRETGQPVGDCIDCNQCVAVCPTGIDIRDGANLACIQCGLCIDACNRVMEKVGGLPDLIAYDTELNAERRERGERESFRIIRPRTLIYVVLIAVVGSIMLYSLATRAFVGVNVLHDRNPVFVRLSEGGIRNGYTVRLLNKRTEDKTLVLSVSGIEGLDMSVVGVSEDRTTTVPIAVDPDTTREIRVLLFADPAALPGASAPVRFRVVDTVTGETAYADDFFKGPKK